MGAAMKLRALSPTVGLRLSGQVVIDASALDPSVDGARVVKWIEQHVRTRVAPRDKATIKIEWSPAT